MAQTGFTPISTYYTTTASAVPTAGNLVNGELALNINTADGKLFYKDSAGVVQVLATKGSATVGGSTTQVQYNNAGVLAGSANFVFDGTNVGIGTSSPNTKLQISADGGAGNSAQLFRITDTNTANGYGPATLTFGNLNHFAAAPTMAMAGTNGISFCVGDGSDLATQRKVLINSSGNVGIGTSSPNRASIGGTALSVENSDQAVFEINRNAARAFYTYISSAGSRISEFRALPMTFFTSDTERMRIDSDGNFLVGASAPPFSNANFAGGSTYVSGNAFINNSSGTSQYNVRLDGFGDQLFVVWANGNTQNNSIYYAYGGTAWVNSSDETLKDIIEPITNAVDKVSQLRSVIGKFKTEKEGTRHPFLIAQDVQKVLPEAVYVNKSRVEGEPDTLGIGYTDVIPLLVSAIQEQQAMIETLTTRLTALEGK
jgi:hypothetical protein